MNYGNCRACKQQVIWARRETTEGPKRVILNPQPDDERGNVLIDGFGFAHYYADRETALAAVAARNLDEPLYLDHHATCVEWAKHRRGPRHSEADDPPEQVSLF